MQIRKFNTTTGRRSASPVQFLVSSWLLAGLTVSSFSLTAQPSHTSVGAVGNPRILHHFDNTSAINGTITAVNRRQLQVGGQWFALADAGVSYAGVAFAFNQLTAGMNVRLTLANGKLQHIELMPDLAGLVTERRPNLLTVNGQQLHYPANTGNNIRRGDYVLVSTGSQQPDQALAVVKAAEHQVPGFIETEGEISALDPAAQRFLLGDIWVDYQVAQLEDGQPANGLWVQVSGQLTDDTLKAWELELDRQAPVVSEISGRISAISADGLQLVLNQRFRFQLTTTTRIDDGNQADLQVGALVELKIDRNSQQLLEIEIKQLAPASVRADVAARAGQ